MNAQSALHMPLPASVMRNQTRQKTPPGSPKPEHRSVQRKKLRSPFGSGKGSSGILVILRTRPYTGKYPYLQQRNTHAILALQNGTRLLFSE